MREVLAKGRALGVEGVAMDQARQQKIARQWAEVCKHLDAAREAWAKVSADTIGPVEELAGYAQYNAMIFSHASQGMTRSEARDATQSVLGPWESSGHINYDPGQ